MKSKEENLGLEERKGPKPGRMRGRFLSVFVVMLLLTGGIIFGLVPRVRQQERLAAKTVEFNIPTVAVVSPKQRHPSSGVPLPAEVKPRVEAPIYARASGYLKRRLVDIGDQVKAGQLLAEIDTPELDQELERARAQLAQAEAQLGLAGSTAARWTDLLRTSSVSKQETEEKQADFKLKTALAKSARAEVRRLEKLKSFADVRAPFSGKITIRNIDIGDLIVAASGKELFHLAQTKTLHVYVQVPQTMARGVSPGQSAQMSLPDLPGRAFKAKVVRTAGVIAADSRTLLVELEVENPKDEILAGGYAEVRFTEAKEAPSLNIPANTLMFRADGPQVGIVRQDGKVELRKVKIGRDFGKTVEIVAGIGLKDRVIVNPRESLVSGALVSIAQPDKKTEGK
jgi:RND family efflux transporter MFP subunit